jgi:hypothetical protein
MEVGRTLVLSLSTYKTPNHLKSSMALRISNIPSHFGLPYVLWQCTVSTEMIDMRTQVEKLLNLQSSILYQHD